MGNNKLICNQCGKEGLKLFSIEECKKAIITFQSGRHLCHDCYRDNGYVEEKCLKN